MHWHNDRRPWNGQWLHPHHAPHGGRLESAAKLIYLAMIVTLGLGKLISYDSSRPRVPEMSRPQEMAAIAQSNAAANVFLQKGKTCSDMDIVAVRNALVEIRERPGMTQLARQHVDLLLQHAVIDTIQLIEQGIRNQDPAFRGQSIFRANEIFLLLGKYQPKMAEPVTSAQVGRGFWKLGKAVFWLYLLFIPFAFVCLFARLSTHQRSVLDELAFGWRRFLLSGIFWIVGLSDYPGDPAKVIRAKRIRYEYLTRTGKQESKLTPEDEAAIEALVLVPQTELRQRLNAIRELSWSAFVRMRMAFYASIVAGYLLAPFSFARAQSSSTPEATATGTNKAVVTQVAPPPPLAEMHAFGQLEASAPRMQSGLNRLFLMGNFHPAEGLDGLVVVNATPTPTLLFADATWRVWGPFGIRVGQLGLRPAYQVPRPDMERLVGGPGVEQFIQFISPGAEVFGDHGWIGWQIACVAGTGPNMPDNNSAKDVVVSMQFKRWGPMLLEGGVQAGQQPEGFRMMSSAHLTLRRGPVDFDLIGVHNRMNGVMTGEGLSSMLAWRVASHVDAAIGHDVLVPADQPLSHTARAQLTLLAVRDLLRLGLHGTWNSLAGFGGTLRLQFGF